MGGPKTSSGNSAMLEKFAPGYRAPNLAEQMGLVAKTGAGGTPSGKGTGKTATTATQSATPTPTYENTGTKPWALK